jgi:hypothetical protein
MIIVGNIYAGLTGGGGGGVTGANNGLQLLGSVVQLGGNPLLNDTVINLSGHDLSFQDTGLGINFSAPNGIVGNADYTNVSLPFQYLQRSSAASFLSTGVNLRLQNTSINPTIATVNATKNQLLRVSVGFFMDNITSSAVIVELIYTDEASNVQTVVLSGGGFTTNGPHQIDEQIIYAEKNTSVKLNVLVGVAATYNIYASVEYLGIEN